MVEIGSRRVDAWRPICSIRLLILKTVRELLALDLFV